MVALSGFYESRKPPPLGEARSIVPPHRDGHQNGQQCGYMLMLQYRCVDCCPGGCRGDTERVIAQWQRPVASCEALVMLYWAMRSVLHRRTAMAVEISRNGGAFVRRRRLF
jgi:hypothetical protein